MNEPNLNKIATQPPIFINGKHLKGLILDEAMETNLLLRNYTLMLKVCRSGDDLIISSAKYIRRDDGQSAIETKEVFPPMAAEPTERNTFIDVEKRQNFRTLRRMYGKLPPKAKERFQMLFRFALVEMNVELIRAGIVRTNKQIK